MTTYDCDLKLQALLTYQRGSSPPKLLGHDNAKISYLEDAREFPQQHGAGVAIDELIKGEIPSSVAQLAAEIGLASQVIYNKNESGGPAHWVELTLIPFTNSDGEVTHFNSVERDISH